MSVDFSRRSLIAPKISILPRLSSSSISGRGRNDNRIVINVGGVRYETYKTTLKNIPDTRLSWLTTKGNNPDYDPETGEYFFDRHPGVFNMILNYYRTGKLHAPTDICGPLFEEELAFWGLDEKQIEPCCWSNYSAHRDAQETLKEMDGGDGGNCDSDSEGEMGEIENIREKFGIIEEAVTDERSIWERWKPRIWRRLDEPKSSRAAKIFAFVSLAFVLTSIMVFCMETHTMFRYSLIEDLDLTTLSVKDKDNLSRPLLFLNVIEYICLSFFTLEIIVRLIFCPDLKLYFRKVYNWIDIFAVIPFYLNIIIVTCHPELQNASGLRFLSALRVIRIFRIFKLTVHVSGLKILGHTIRASAKELLLLSLVLIIGVLIFACLIYFAEQVEEPSKNSFPNIPSGFWWAVVTMTTLGYGDLIPRTALGYIVGTVCAVCGLLMLSLPVPVIVSNFTLYYTHAQARLKLPRKSKKKVLLNAANALVDQEESPGSSFDADEQNAEKAGSNQSIERTSSEDSAIGSSYDKTKQPVDAASSARSNRVGISVIFTDELHEGGGAGGPPSRPPSPSGSEDSNKSQKNLSPKHATNRCRHVNNTTAPGAAARRNSSLMSNIAHVHI